VVHYLRTGERLPDPSLQVQKQVVLEHYQEMLEYYGVEAGIRIARKHIGWYSTGMFGSAEFRHAVNQLENADRIIEMIGDFYDRAIERSLKPEMELVH
jgi:tRNA-dihydrouridine synthase B